MCELMAMSANVPTDICFSFSGLMQRGGNTGPHKMVGVLRFMRVKVAVALKTRYRVLIRLLLSW